MFRHKSASLVRPGEAVVHARERRVVVSTTVVLVFADGSRAELAPRRRVYVRSDAEVKS